MHSSMMRIALSLTVSCSIPSILGGGLSNPYGYIFPPSGCRPPPPPSRCRPPGYRPPPPGCRPHPPGHRPPFPMHAGKPTPLLPSACWEANTPISIACLEASPPVKRMTDKCKNITFANFVCGQ